MQDYQEQCAQMAQIQLGLCKSINSITGLLECNSQQSDDNKPKCKKRCKQWWDMNSFDNNYDLGDLSNSMVVKDPFIFTPFGNMAQF